MQKILNKRVFRDLKENKFRYMALCLLVIFSMFIIVGIIGGAEVIMQGTEKSAKDHKLEDGEFSVFVPLSDRDIKTLSKDGTKIEEQFYMDFTKDNVTLRVFKEREKINLSVLAEGEKASSDNEATVERRYAAENNVKIGDEIKIADSAFKVTGFVTTPDYDQPLKSMSDTQVNSSCFGTVFLTANAYEKLKNGGKADRAEEYSYAFILGSDVKEKDFREEVKNIKIEADEIDDDFFKEYWENNGGRIEELQNGISDLVDGSKELSDGLYTLKEADPYAEDAYNASVKLSDGLTKLKEETDSAIDEEFGDYRLSNLTQYVKAEDNIRIAAASADQVINKYGGIVVGIILIILFAYVISIFVVHSIEKDAVVIGALYSLGVKRKELMLHFCMLPVAVTFAGGLIGTLLGFSKFGIDYQIEDCYNYYSIPDLDKIIPPYLIVYGVIIPPLLAAIVNYIVIRKKLSMPVLKLLRNEHKQSKGKSINLNKLSFKKAFQIRQIMKEGRSALAVVMGMFISLIIVMMGLNCFVLCQHVKKNNVNDTRYEYMYTLKYPMDEVPSGGEEAYVKSFKKEIFGMKFDVNVMGIKDNSKYFPYETTNSKTNVVISSAFSTKFNVYKGQEFTLMDEEDDTMYSFVVEDVCDYAPVFTIFMNIDKARELFGEKDDYFNVICSDKKLDIESGRLYATTEKSQIKEASDVFIELMLSFMIILIGGSIFIFIVVMYLMMKVMIDRSAFNIAMVKIFGYRKKEIKQLYLNGNFYIICIGAIISIPLAKLIMDKLYPILCSNVNCALDLRFDLWMYGAVFVVILILYLIINTILVRNIEKMTPADVLKNRE